MYTYETSATVEERGQVHLALPFAPGTRVEIKVCASDELTPADQVTLAAARLRMQELFQTVSGFRNSPHISRDELYER